MYSQGLTRKGKLKRRLFILFWITFLLSLSFEISSIYLRSGLLHYLIVLTGRIVCIAAVVYANIFVFLPKFLRKNKYFLYVLSLLASMVFLYLGMAFFNYLIWLTNVRIQVFTTDKYYVFIIIFTTLRISFLAYLLYVAMEWIDQKMSIQALEVEKKEAENKYLRNQLNPHFLFNTMNNLHGLILTNTKLASESLLRFSDFLHYMVYESSEDYILLGKELDLVKDYLALERLRAEPIKRIELMIETNDLNYKIAPLLILPLIENGIKHGLNVVEDNAFLNVIIRQYKKQLDVSVVNSSINNTKERGNGIGLKNLQRRLQLQYPQSHELNITDEGGIFTTSLKITLDEL